MPWSARRATGFQVGVVFGVWVAAVSASLAPSAILRTSFAVRRTLGGEAGMTVVGPPLGGAT
jgi:hypothetical protein